MAPHTSHTGGQYCWQPGAKRRPTRAFCVRAFCVRASFISASSACSLDKYNSLGGALSFLLLPTSGELVNPDGFGRRNLFANGPIYWSAATGRASRRQRLQPEVGREGLGGRLPQVPEDRRTTPVWC
ncbi:LGFP repeat-containing protein [Rhodococcus kronopolitis]|uniref:LGFP repeat-containing protein n=1 Tax=Rhodococcus kronopolitis TaxID=1460226 RepID=A0ABV9FP60_9NOCA